MRSIVIEDDSRETFRERERERERMGKDPSRVSSIRLQTDIITLHGEMARIEDGVCYV